MSAPPDDRPDDRGPLPGLEPGHDCWAQVFADMERVAGPIRRDARRMHLPASEVDDAVQDAFCQAWAKRSEYDASRPLIPWLRGFGRKAIVARLLALSRDEGPERSERVGLACQRELLPDQSAEVRENSHRMRALIAQAPSKCQEVLQARYWEGLRILEVANRLGRSSKAVERCLSRALGWLEVGWRGARVPDPSRSARKENQDSEGENPCPFG